MTYKMKALSILTASVAVAGVLVAPAATAHTKHTHKHAHHHAAAGYMQMPQGGMGDHKMQALEAQVQSMQYELQSLRAEAANRPAMNTGAQAAKVEELDQWMNTVKAKHAEHAEHGHKGNNMVFFRGGYLHTDNLRGGTLDPTASGGNSGGVLNGSIGQQDAWYFGAGFDWSLSPDLFGAMHGTELFAELMFDYKELGRSYSNGITPAIGQKTGLPGVNIQKATVNQLSLAASPKIKFMKGSAFRPWLVPVGFELNVVSPPSDAITVLNAGMQFGFGADYNIWKNLFVGADARYHYAPGNIDGVNTNGVTAGGYVGIGF